MSRDDRVERMRRAVRTHDREPKVLHPGEVYICKDRAIALPETDRKGTRTYHPTRHVIVVQAAHSNTLGEQRTVLVVPCSSSVPPGPYDIEFIDENGFAPGKVSVFPSLIQPILPSDLKDRREGKITPEGLDTLHHRIAVLLGFAPHESMPDIGVTE